MTFSYDQLNTPLTEDEAEELAIERLAELGFASKGWQDGDVQLTIGPKLHAWLLSRGTQVAQSILLGLLNETSTEDFLTRFSYSHYANIRNVSQAYRYAVRLTVAAGEGPYTVNAEELIATNGVYFYKNVDDGLVPYPVSLTSAAPVTLTFEAEIPGTLAAAADGTITTLVTTLAGVTINNPGPSLVRAGANQETDANLRERNRTKWATRAVDMPEAGYVNLAREAFTNARVAVDSSNPRGPGTVDVYIAGESDVAGSGDVTAVDTLLQARRGVTVDLMTIAAASTDIVVTGVVYMRAPATLSAIKEAIKAYVNFLPIGGEELTTVDKGVAQDGIEAAIRSVDGVKNVNLSTINGVAADDVVLNPFDIARTSDSNLAGLTSQQV